MSELSKKKETFVDSLNLLNSAKKMAEKALVEIVKEVQIDYEGYVAFNDETAFPYFVDDYGESDAVVAVRVRKTKGGFDELQFCTEVDCLDEEDSWFYPYHYGEFDLDVLYTCITEYADLHEMQ